MDQVDQTRARPRASRGRGQNRMRRPPQRRLLRAATFTASGAPRCTPFPSPLPRWSTTSRTTRAASRTLAPSRGLCLARAPTAAPTAAPIPTAAPTPMTEWISTVRLAGMPLPPRGPRPRGTTPPAPPPRVFPPRAFRSNPRSVSTLGPCDESGGSEPEPEVLCSSLVLYRERRDGEGALVGAGCRECEGVKLHARDRARVLDASRVQRNLFLVTFILRLACCCACAIVRKHGHTARPPLLSAPPVPRFTVLSLLPPPPFLRAPWPHAIWFPSQTTPPSPVSFPPLPLLIVSPAPLHCRPHLLLQSRLSRRLRRRRLCPLRRRPHHHHRHHHPRPHHTSHQPPPLTVAGKSARHGDARRRRDTRHES